MPYFIPNCRLSNYLDSFAQGLVDHNLFEILVDLLSSFKSPLSNDHKDWPFLFGIFHISGIASLKLMISYAYFVHHSDILIYEIE